MAENNATERDIIVTIAMRLFITGSLNRIRLPFS
jgi:hypothetical protein